MNEWKEAPLGEKIAVVLAAIPLLLIYLPALALQNYRNKKIVERERKEYFRKKREEETK